MRRKLLAGLAGLALAVLVGPAAGKAAALVAIANFPLPQRAAQAEVVVAGKVTAIAAKTTKAERFKGDKEMGEYQIVTVKVAEAFFGAKGLTHIKVGFLPPAPPRVPGAEDQPIRIRPIRPGFQPINLAKDQEAILFLQPHHSGDFYLINGFQGVVDAKNPEYKQNLEELKKISKVVADPMAALKSKDAGERLQAASTLLYRYKQNRPGQTKQEPINAEESKLILQAMAEANWDAPRTGRFENHPNQLFNLLGIQPKDGFVRPADARQFPAAAKKWLQDNAGTFKVTRWAAATQDR